MKVPLQEALYNLSTRVKRLFGRVGQRELSVLMAGTPRELPGLPAPQCRLTPPQVEQLIMDYKAGVRSTYVLARNYRVDRSTISLHFRGAGLKLERLPLTDTEVARAAKLRSEGHPYEAIGRAMRRDPETIKKALS